MIPAADSKNLLWCFLFEDPTVAPAQWSPAAEQVDFDRLTMGTWSAQVSVSPHKSTQSLSAALFAPFWVPTVFPHCWNSSKTSHCRGCRWHWTSSSIVPITHGRETTFAQGSYFYIHLWLCSVLPLQLKNPTHMPEPNFSHFVLSRLIQIFPLSN